MATNWRSHPRYQGKDLDELPQCTVEELEEIITGPSGGFTMLPNEAYHEVYPSIFLGEASAAKSRHLLKRLGVTHVLNAAKGKGQFWVDTGKAFYREFGMEFLGIEATDTLNFKLNEHFDEAADFIDNAIKSKGKVMANCVQGVSRSATLVLAYLMLKCKMTAQDAVRTVRDQREISPNAGFLQQLCDLNERLWEENHFEKERGACDDSVDKIAQDDKGK
ncbi:dual specificity protein phosphatase 3-like [Lineus longissimus]|uniref:dual specificity protein phosphatase 3-like n=1 Tax=Lineus longissimus TaxID=88925 RepID=UPI002B4FB139